MAISKSTTPTLCSSTSRSSSTITTSSIIFMTLLLLIIINGFINMLNFRLKPRKKGKQPPLPPGPVPWPLIGNFPALWRNKPTFRWIHHLMKEMNIEIACLHFGNIYVIPVTCPKIGLEFLKKQDAVFASRPHTMATSLISGGYLSTVLSPYGNQWKKMRRILTTELICPARHKWLHAKRVEEADNLVKYVYNQCVSSDRVNLRTTTRHYCGNVIRRLMFNSRYFGDGMEDGGPGIEEEEHVHALFTGLAYAFNFRISDYFSCFLGLDLDGHEKILNEFSRIIKKYHDPIIDERIKQWKHVSQNNNGTEKMEPHDLLDVLIALEDANGKPLLTPEEIKAQTTEIIMAAVDNPSNAVEWAMAEMINQPKMLQKAIKELDRVVGKERLVQESDILHLNYVKACAREAFRLHPVAPFNIPHVAMLDTTIAGYSIPKGSHVLLSRIGLGRNPKVWDEPLKFKPERHLNDASPEVVLTEPDLRFITFTTGRRGCIAATLGTAMTIMLLARLLQGFTWSASPTVSSIDLTELEDELYLAKPLIAHAKPRLPLSLYPIN